MLVAVEREFLGRRPHGLQTATHGLSPARVPPTLRVSLSQASDVVDVADPVTDSAARRPATRSGARRPRPTHRRQRCCGRSVRAPTRSAARQVRTRRPRTTREPAPDARRSRQPGARRPRRAPPPAPPAVAGAPPAPRARAEPPPSARTSTSGHSPPPGFDGARTDPDACAAIEAQKAVAGDGRIAIRKRPPLRAHGGARERTAMIGLAGSGRTPCPEGPKTADSSAVTDRVWDKRPARRTGLGAGHE